MLHDVHIYHVYRVKITNVEAETHEAACAIARDMNWGGYEIEDACEVVGFMVDEVGDDEFLNTTSHEADCELLKALAS